MRPTSFRLIFFSPIPLFFSETPAAAVSFPFQMVRTPLWPGRGDSFFGVFFMLFPPGRSDPVFFWDQAASPTPCVILRSFLTFPPIRTLVIPLWFF